MENKPFTFPKSNRLTGKTTINNLYKEGKSFLVFPFFVVFTPGNKPQNRVLVSVPKRNFKHAVDRNWIRRRIKEAYRLHQAEIEVRGLNLAFNYIAKEKLTTAKIEQKLQKAILKLNETILSDVAD